MTLLCSNIVLIIFLESVSLTMRLKVSFLSVTTKLAGHILVGTKQLPKSFSVVCIGLPYSKMPICMAKVTLVSTV